eukprot:5944208-Pyramimonas_sp.AAC.1
MALQSYHLALQPGHRALRRLQLLRQLLRLPPSDRDPTFIVRSRARIVRSYPTVRIRLSASHARSANS